MKKKKIAVLHAQIPFLKGGAEHVVGSLTRELIKRDFDAEIVQIPWKWYPNESLIDSIMAWRFLDLTEGDGQKIDLVIGCKFPSYVAKHPSKVLWLMHQHRMAYDLYDKEQYGGMLYCDKGPETREIVRQIDNQCFDECKLRYSISKNVTKRMEYYNQRTAEPIYHPPSLHGRYFCEDCDDYILSIGRLAPIKRNALLISALPYCDKRIRAKIGGIGPDLPALQKLAHDLKVEDRVDFLGFLNDEDMLKAYANAMGVFFAPVDEDYGYITLEAFFSKKPVITCHDSGGVLEFVTDDENGFITNTAAEEIGYSIDKLFANKQKSIAMGKNGYEVVKDISWDNVINKLTATL